MYRIFFTEKLKDIIFNKESVVKYRINDSNFIRNRKMNFEKVVLYALNKKGLSTKMEIEEFTDMVNMCDISSPAVLKQRLKLNGIIYLDMLRQTLLEFYKKCQNEVKLYKGYILTAIDGSDFEIPNTKQTREKYNTYHKNDCAARASISNMFDLLNHFVMDTIISKYDYSERKMAKQNLINVKKMELPFPIIRIMDRGYTSLPDMYYSSLNDDKFVVRLQNKDFIKEIEAMKTKDEVISIQYNNQRMRYYKNEYPEFYDLITQTKEDIKIRVVKIENKEGETIKLATNLPQSEFSYEEMVELYKLRWKIELNYHCLKESLKIEAITSSNEIIIEQDIYSQMVVYNFIQTIKQDAEKKIDQSKYKNEMKINMNMAVGFVKKAFTKIMLEENTSKQEKMLELLEKKIEKYLIPVKKDRHYPRNNIRKNKYSINKRKTF